MRLRRADQGAAALATTRCSTCTRRCCRAGAARRRSSGRSWPATRRPACRSCALTAGCDSGPVCLAGARADPPDDDYGTLAGAAASGSAATCWCGRSTSGPPFVEQDEDGGHLRAQDRSAATARWTRRGRPRRSSARCARCARTSARGCRCPTATFLGVLGGARRRRHAGAPPAAASAPTGERLLLDCNGGALELTEIRPPGGRPMAARGVAARPPGPGADGLLPRPARCPTARLDELLERAKPNGRSDAEWAPCARATPGARRRLAARELALVTGVGVRGSATARQLLAGEGRGSGVSGVTRFLDTRRPAGLPCHLSGI